MPKLIRIVKETRTVVELGEANSSNPSYWERDFKPVRKIVSEEVFRDVQEPLRELTPTETILYSEILNQ